MITKCTAHLEASKPISKIDHEEYNEIQPTMTYSKLLENDLFLSDDNIDRSDIDFKASLSKTKEK